MENKSITFRKEEDLKILFSPIRIKILDMYSQHKDPLTVKQLADYMGESPSKIHYHVMKLLKLGVLVLVRTETINGIIAKYYKKKYKHIYHASGSYLPRDVFPALTGVFERKFIDACKTMQMDIKKLSAISDEQYSKRNYGMLLLHDKLYLTKEERKEVINTLHVIMKKYSKVDESKDAYSNLFTLVQSE